LKKEILSDFYGIKDIFFCFGLGGIGFFLFLFLALLVGISRVYLLQHFFRDVYAGSMVGVVISSVFYLTFVRSGFYNSLHWKDKALLKW
jgi:membrane-associated phospholipid phosphatase